MSDLVCSVGHGGDDDPAGFAAIAECLPVDLRGGFGVPEPETEIDERSPQGGRAFTADPSVASSASGLVETWGQTRRAVELPMGRPALRVTDRGAVVRDSDRTPSRGGGEDRERCEGQQIGDRRVCVGDVASIRASNTKSSASISRAICAPGTGSAWRAASTIRSASGPVIRTPRRAAKSRSRAGPSRTSRAGSDRSVMINRPALDNVTDHIVVPNPGKQRSTCVVNCWIVRRRNSDRRCR